MESFQCIDCTANWETKLQLYLASRPHMSSRDMTVSKVPALRCIWSRMAQHKASEICRVNQIQVVEVQDGSRDSGAFSALETIIILTIAEMKGHIAADLHNLLMQFTVLSNPKMAKVIQLWKYGVYRRTRRCDISSDRTLLL